MVEVVRVVTRARAASISRVLAVGVPMDRVAQVPTAPVVLEPMDRVVLVPMEAEAQGQTAQLRAPMAREVPLQTARVERVQRRVPEPLRAQRGPAALRVQMVPTVRLPIPTSASPM